MEKITLLKFFEVLSSKIEYCFLPKNKISTLGFKIPNTFFFSPQSENTALRKVGCHEKVSKTGIEIFFYSFGNLVTLVLICFLGFSSQIYGQFAPVTTPSTGFAIDGGLRANTPTSPPPFAINQGDWYPTVGAQGASVFNNSNVVISPATGQTSGRASGENFNGNDNVFTTGSKFNGYVSDLKWFANSAPDKNDINNALYHVARDDSNNQWIFISGDRLSTSGTSYIDFELLQGTIDQSSGGSFTGTPAVGKLNGGGRTQNDIIISMEYTNGGTKPLVYIYQWKLSGSTWSYQQLTPSSGLSANAFAETNRTGAESNVPYLAFGTNTYQQFAFVEAAVNISYLLQQSGLACSGINIKTLWVKTKASASSTAALKDFISPIPVDFKFGESTIVAITPKCASDNTAYPLSAIPSGGTFSGPGVEAGVNGSYSFTPSLAAASTGTTPYEITYITVDKSCTATTQIVVNPTPAGTNISQTLCSSAAGGSTASFDLTSKNATVVVASGTTVLGWYETYSAGVFSNPISPANAYVSGNKTIYAKLSGTGGCIGVANNVLTVNATPAGANTTQTLCSSAAGGTTATFDLTSKNATVIGASGATVLGWYKTYSAGSFSDQITIPAAYVSGSRTVYAKLSGTGSCIGVANDVLTVNTTPLGANTTQTLCSSAAGGITATFDLTSKNALVAGASGATVLGWYETYSAGSFSDPITTPAAYVSGSRTVYVKLSGTGSCIGVANDLLTVNTTPLGANTTQTLCSSSAGGSTATFDLTSKNAIVAGASSATVLGWYETYSAGSFSDQITTPAAYVSGSRTVYAKLSGTGSCIGVANDLLTVNTTPLGANTTQTLCSSAAGGSTASFDLTSKNATVVGASGATVLEWYETYSAGSFSDPITTPAAYVSGSRTVYAKLSGTGSCIGVANDLLTVNTTPLGANTTQTLCSSAAGGTTATFDLTSKNATVVGASGATVLEWYETYSAGSFSDPIASPGVYVSGSKTVYAKLSGTGGCIGVANNVLTVNATPSAPTVVYNPPACDKATFSITITSVTSGAIYTVKDKNAENIMGILPSNSITANGTGDITFSNIPAGSGYQVSISVNGCGSGTTTCGTSIAAKIANIDTKTTVAAAPIEAKTTTVGFDAYPVPFKDQLTIKYKFDYKSDVRIEVFNAQGMSVLSKTDTDSYLDKEVTLDLKASKRQDQVYIVKMTTNQGTFTKKIMSSK